MGQRASKILGTADDRLEQWMVCQEPEYGNSSYNPNPKHLYTSESVARAAAENLARDNEKSYFLLKVVDIVEVQKAPISWLVGE